MGEDTNSEPQREAQGLGPAVALAAASRAGADEFLAEQTALARLQIARERKEESLRNWSQFVSYASAVLKLAFEFVVALIVVVIGAAVGAALWNAAHDKGLVIEAFSVAARSRSAGPDRRGRRRQGARPPHQPAGPDLVNRAASSYVNNWAATSRSRSRRPASRSASSTAISRSGWAARRTSPARSIATPRASPSPRGSAGRPPRRSMAATPISTG